MNPITTDPDALGPEFPEQAQATPDPLTDAQETLDMDDDDAEFESDDDDSDEEAEVEDETEKE